MDMAGRIIKLRKQNGLSQEQFGDKLNVSRQAVSKWESGQTTPDLEYIINMCELFSITTDYLLLGKEDNLKDSISENEIQVNISPASVKVVSLANKPFLLGGLLTVLSVIGVIVFIALSVIDPWGVTTSSGRYYEGLIGFLLGSQTMIYFIICCVIGCVGIGLCFYTTFSDKFREKSNLQE